MKAKQILMALLVLAAGVFTTTGMPTNQIAWAAFGITVAIAFLGYLAQSKLLPTTSIPGSIDWIDFVKGLLVAASNVLGNFSAAHIVGQPVNWHAILLATVGVFVAYIIKQFSAFPIPGALK